MTNKLFHNTKSFFHFQRKYKKLKQQYKSGQIELKHLNDCVRGWVNHVRYGNTVGLRKAVLGKLAVIKELTLTGTDKRLKNLVSQIKPVGVQDLFGPD